MNGISQSSRLPFVNQQQNPCPGASRAQGNAGNNADAFVIAPSRRIQFRLPNDVSDRTADMLCSRAAPDVRAEGVRLAEQMFATARNRPNLRDMPPEQRQRAFQKYLSDIGYEVATATAAMAAMVAFFKLMKMVETI